MQTANLPQPMKLDPDRLASRLEAELSRAAVRRQPDLLAARAVDGVYPCLVCSPANPEEVSAALRVCSEMKAAITPWGGGTAVQIGNLPERVDVIIDLSKLNQVIEHDDANLTAIVQSGITLAATQAVTAGARQFVPFDAPNPQRSTVGGIVAANLNGVRRSCYGSVRDLVIGMKIALPTGEHIKAGGKVVKNVAGYDMCKLFVGSLGTLGIITELTLRLTPLPEEKATLAASGSLLQLSEFAGEIVDSVLLPSAIVLWKSETSSGSGALPLDWQMAVSAEGFAEHVGRHLRDLQLMAERLGLSTVIYSNAAREKLWAGICDFRLLGHELVFRIMVPRSAVTDLLNGVQDWDSTDYSPAIAADVAAGTIWIGSNQTKSAAARFAQLRSKAAQHKGHVVLVSAPADLKRDLDIWGPAPAAFFLMRRIKQQFDPQRLMNPGRFVGRL
jgi:glycolate oxidase FAD binding subunit